MQNDSIVVFSEVKENEPRIPKKTHPYVPGSHACVSEA